MKDSPIKLPLASSTWGEEEIAAINRVVQSGMFTMGENVLQFERELAGFIGSRFAVMVNSGSSANLLMTAALFFRKVGALKKGDEVLVPAVSWSTTYYPLSQYGLRLKFVDIDRRTLNYNLGALKETIGVKTRMIVAVNLLGNPNDFGAIQSIIGNRDVLLLEDNCEALGATYLKRKTGTFGLMGSVSTFFSHHMSTMEGGVIVTNDEELYHILLCIRAHGWTRNLPRNNHVTGLKSDDAFEESFKFVLPGYNVRPLEMEGAIGIEQLRKLPDFLRHRRANAGLFKELFSNHPFVDIQEEIGESSWFGFALTIKEETGVSRKRLVALLQESEVECRPIVAGNFAKNPVVQLIDHDVPRPLTNAERIDKLGLFIGNHHYDISTNLRKLRKLFDLLAQ